jgi:hypothetical protein
VISDVFRLPLASQELAFPCSYQNSGRWNRHVTYVVYPRRVSQLYNYLANSEVIVTHNDPVLILLHSFIFLLVFSRRFDPRNTQEWEHNHLLETDIHYTSTNKKSSIFWDIMPSSPVGVNRRFEGTCHLHFQQTGLTACFCWFLARLNVQLWKRRRYVPPKRRLTFTGYSALYPRR